MLIIHMLCKQTYVYMCVYVFGIYLKINMYKCGWRGGNVPAGHSDKSIDRRTDGWMDGWTPSWCLISCSSSLSQHEHPHWDIRQ